MIGLAESCKGGTALANYVMQDAKGYELFRNGVAGETPTEILQEMRIIQDLNQKGINRTLSLVISPEPSDGEKLTDKELEGITKEILKELDIDPSTQQLIAFVHDEKLHKHVHVIANRVKLDGSLIKDGCIGKRAQWAAHRAAEKRGLISAKAKMITNLNDKEYQMDLDKVIKGEILNKHKFVINQKPKSMQVYFEMMKELGVHVTPTINKAGRVQGMRMIDSATDKDFKASDVHRSLSLSKVMKTNSIPYDTPCDAEAIEEINMSEGIEVFNEENTSIETSVSKSIVLDGLELALAMQESALNGVTNEGEENKKRRKRKKIKR